jgi:hypothetical protein
MNKRKVVYPSVEMEITKNTAAEIPRRASKSERRASCKKKEKRRERESMCGVYVYICVRSQRDEPQ